MTFEKETIAHLFRLVKEQALLIAQTERGTPLTDKDHIDAVKRLFIERGRVEWAAQLHQWEKTLDETTED